jgi:cytochrome P450
VATRDSDVLEQPSHIDRRRIVDYDIFEDPRFKAAGDPHAALRQLGADAGYGIFWTPRNGGHWFINDYELIFQAARAPDLFSSKAMTVPPMPAELEPRLIPLTLDPPEHGAYRLPLMRAFAPARVKAMEPSIRAFTAQLVESIADQGRCDFVHAIAEPLPIIIFMRLMGMDISRLGEFRRWIVDMMQPDEATRARSYANIREMMGELIEARKRERAHDLISALLDSDIDGRPVTTEEMHGYCLLLFAAGLDTVANAMAFSMRHLAGDADLQNRLRENPNLIPEAVEEFLRKFGVPTPPRTVSRDAQFGGVHLKAGERVVLLLPACNFDPKVFPEPEKFALGRENMLHLTFNSGPHRCIGAHLARLELKTLYEEWFKRMPNVRLDPATAPQYRLGLALACVKLPLLWHPVDKQSSEMS